ncbi:hypothetical protein BDB01DRAFT_771092, partial [Pilobolus umbonatus]
MNTLFWISQDEVNQENNFIPPGTPWKENPHLPRLKANYHRERRSAMIARAKEIYYIKLKALQAVLVKSTTKDNIPLEEHYEIQEINGSDYLRENEMSLQQTSHFITSYKSGNEKPHLSLLQSRGTKRKFAEDDKGRIIFKNDLETLYIDQEKKYYEEYRNTLKAIDDLSYKPSSIHHSHHHSSTNKQYKSSRYLSHTSDNKF